MELEDQQQIEQLRSNIDEFNLSWVNQHLANYSKDQQPRVERHNQNIVPQQLEQLSGRIERLSLSDRIDERLTNSLLRLAVQQNNVEQIVELLKQGANPNATNEDGSTPLHTMAANPSQYDTMERFFQCIDEKIQHDDAQKSVKVIPLRVALGQEYEKIKPLLKEHYSPTPSKRYGSIKYSGLVDMLFDGKHQLVRLDAQDRSGDTPLHLAARSRNEKAIALLLRRGADSAFRNLRGQDAQSDILKNSVKSTDSSIDANTKLNKRASKNERDKRVVSARTRYDRMKAAERHYQLETASGTEQREPVDFSLRESPSLHKNINRQNLNELDNLRRKHSRIMARGDPLSNGNDQNLNRKSSPLIVIDDSFIRAREYCARIRPQMRAMGERLRNEIDQNHNLGLDDSHQMHTPMGLANPLSNGNGQNLNLGLSDWSRMHTPMGLGDPLSNENGQNLNLGQNDWYRLPNPIDLRPFLSNGNGELKEWVRIMDNHFQAMLALGDPLSNGNGNMARNSISGAPGNFFLNIPHNNDMNCDKR